MSLKNILKLAALGAVVYGAYKYGEYKGEQKSSEPDYEPKGDNKVMKKVDEVVQETKDEIQLQIEVVRAFIEELVRKPNKTQKDKDNLDLLNIKLEQLNKQR